VTAAKTTGEDSYQAALKQAAAVHR